MYVESRRTSRRIVFRVARITHLDLVNSLCREAYRGIWTAKRDDARQVGTWSCFKVSGAVIINYLELCGRKCMPKKEPIMYERVYGQNLGAAMDRVALDCDGITYQFQDEGIRI